MFTSILLCLILARLIIEPNLNLTCFQTNINNFFLSQTRLVHKQFGSFIALNLMSHMTYYFDYHELNYILEWASVHQMTQRRFYTL